MGWWVYIDQYCGLVGVDQYCGLVGVDHYCGLIDIDQYCGLVGVDCEALRSCIIYTTDICYGKDPGKAT